MSTERPDLEALLDAGDEDALAEAVQSDAALGEALDLQQAIDASLRRAFAVPDLEGLHQRLHEAAEVGAVMEPAPSGSVVVPMEAHAPPRSSWLSSPIVTIAAAAAAIVLVVLLGRARLEPARSGEPEAVAVAVVDPPAPPDGPPTAASRWVDLYRGLPPEGFGVLEPHVMGDPPDGASCASDGSSALVVRPTAGLTVRSECSTEPPCTQWGLDASRVVELMVDPQGLRVMVFVHAAQADPRPSLPSGSRFHLYRRQLGHLVLYELSPLQRPVGLDVFEL